MQVKRKSIRKPNFKVTVDDLFLFFLVIVSWIFFALNKGNADYDNYLLEYTNINLGQESNYFEVGFFLLCRMGGFLKLLYPVFFAVIATIIIVLLLKCVSKLSNKKSTVWIAYMIYPFVFDIVQYRNMLAFVIVLYGLTFYLSQGDKKGIMKYCICVLLSMSIHLSSIVYFAFLLTIIKKRRDLIKWVTIGLITIFVVCIGVNYLNTVLSFFHLDRFTRYEHTASFSTFAQYMLMYVFLLFAIMVKYKGDFEDIRIRITIISILFLPFIIVTGSSSRFIRSMLVYFYATVNHCLPNEGGFKRMIYHTIPIGVALIIFCFQLSSGLYHESVLEPILQQNWLWEKGR